MSKRTKLLLAIRDNPKGVRFADLLRLIEAIGFVFDRQAGSHQVYRHPRAEVPFINVQEGKAGKAKPYQVEQVLAIIEQHNLEA